MSNQQVGTVFDRVIQEVCDASQVDFEESGVDQQTLLDLRKSWQAKLSSLGVAQFPWDPTPQPNNPPQNQNQPPAQTPTQPPNQNPILPPTATVPSNAPRPAASQPPQQHVPPQQSLPQSMPSTAPPLQAPTPISAAPMGQGPHIKTEPGLNAPGMPQLNMMPGNPQNSQSARERAANMLHQKYGAAAANSVSQLQAQSHLNMGMPGHPGQPGQSGQSSQPGQPGQPGQPRPQNMPQMPNGQPQIKQEPGYPPMPQHPVGNSQTDGAGDDALSDWKAEVARRRAAAQRQGGEGDRLLRQHVNQRMLQMEGGGLLLPLDQQRSAGPSALDAMTTATRGLELDEDPSAGPSKNMPRGQFDGPGGDDEQEEDDEDAINSDLDDPDDLVAEDHDAEDSMGQVMLCTYDKVQRVKNKWKCTLKDGILTTGGKEYVFHKGQGEFEW